MKVKEVFEELIEQGYEPKYFFHGKNLIIDPDESEPVEGFKAIGNLGLMTVSDPPFDSGNVEEWIFHEVTNDIESSLRKDGIDPDAEVNGYFVYYDTEWKAWYPLILVRDWKLSEKTHDEPEKLHLLLSINDKYIDSGTLKDAKIGPYLITRLNNSKGYVEVCFDWILRGLAQLYPNAVKEGFHYYEIDLRKLRENLPNRF